MSATPVSILKKYFGYKIFRPMQEEIISTVMSGKDILVLMPTGGGKSLCFQIPAMALDGICIVISPLIALMKDQVDALRTNGIEANFMNSSQSDEEQSVIAKLCLNEKCKLLYVSPERLATEGFLEFLKRLEINLFAIDEAHCISFWGHDFRPEYKKLKILKSEFPHIPIIALTATADKLTRKDILTELNLRDPKVFISSFDRPNINLTVKPAINRSKQILNFLESKKNDPGIIYCLSRNSTEKVVEKLRSQGLKARHYHAGMSGEERAEVQNLFLNDDIQIICATVAFGMGIDKSNVRWVIHYNLPKNIEGYYQEIGRAGRDGLDAHALMFYSISDVILQKKMLEDLSPERQKVQSAKLERLQQYSEANICRRKILMNYFSENLDADCNNCDVCIDPREKFDGTIIGQKAFSAISRLGQKVSATILIDVLRGSQNQYILQNDFDKIKTYGVGKDLSFDEWREYIQQLISSGFIDIAYDENLYLKLNENSHEVLFKNKKIELTKYLGSYKSVIEKEKQKSKTEVIRDELFEVLRNLRKKIATEENLPPYIIFTDKSLSEMSQKRPMTKFEMLQISGVGEAKYKKYGEIFLSGIDKFVRNFKEPIILGETHNITLDLLKKNLTVDEIASKRNIKSDTIYSQIAELISKNKNLNINKIISKDEINIVKEAVKICGRAKLKPIYEFLNEEISYGQIKVALAIIK